MASIDLLKTMLAMAAADGGLTVDEIQLLSDRAVMWGLTADDFQAVLQEAGGDDVEIHVPPLKSERIEMLSEAVRMMGADGVVHEAEKRMLAVIALKMELDEDDVNRAIDGAMRDLDP